MMSKSWAKGSTTRWRKLREAVLNRDNWTCQRCGKHLNPKLPRTHPDSATVHHKLGRAITGDEDDRYLEAACRACNLEIGDPTKGPDPAPKPVTRW